eukprot:m.386716 g.386716  ORF g.386716 m.386716 type:complete len:569 (+) comp20056_c2_seq1:331-2037(+)
MAEPTTKEKKRVRLQRVVVHEAHFADPETENHLYHEHVEVSSEELFYDLVFVSAVIELATFLKQDLSSGRLFITLLLFTTLWLTWFHTNMLLTRFHLPKRWKAGLFLVMLGTLGVGVHSVDDRLTTGDNHGFDVHLLGLFLSILMTRVALLATYTLICWQVPLARPMISKYVFCLAVSSVLAIAAAASGSAQVAVIIWSIACALEMLMYPLGLLTPKVYRMTVNMEHALERTQLWVILVLGEAVIALVSSSHGGDFGASYYWTTILGFLIVFCVLKIHIRSQLEYDVTADEHALEESAAWAVLFDLSQLMITAGMVGLAVGLKLAVLHSGDHKYKRSYALMLTCSLGYTLVWMNIARACHKFADYELFGTKWGRHIVWGFHTVLSFVIMPLGFAVRDISSKEKQPVEPPVLLALVSVVVMLLWWLESFLKALDDPEEEGLDTHGYAHAFSVGTQTTLLSFSDTLGVRKVGSRRSSYSSRAPSLSGRPKMVSTEAGSGTAMDDYMVENAAPGDELSVHVDLTAAVATSTSDHALSSNKESFTSADALLPGSPEPSVMLGGHTLNANEEV